MLRNLPLVAEHEMSVTGPVSSGRSHRLEAGIGPLVWTLRRKSVAGVLTE
jgi:hypothetical protein